LQNVRPASAQKADVSASAAVSRGKIDSIPRDGRALQPAAAGERDRFTS